MGNKGATGPFAPLVVQARNVIGKKEFNKLRGKAISLHSQGGLHGEPPAPFLMFFSHAEPQSAPRCRSAELGWPCVCKLLSIGGCTRPKHVQANSMCHLILL